MGGGAPHVSPPPIVSPPPTPALGDNQAEMAAEAIRRRERLAKGHRSTLLSGLYDTQATTGQRSLLG